MSEGAPCLWELIGGLFMADEDLKSWRQHQAAKKGSRTTGPDVNPVNRDNQLDERRHTREYH